MSASVLLAGIRRPDVGPVGLGVGGDFCVGVSVELCRGGRMVYMCARRGGWDGREIHLVSVPRR